MLRAKKYAKMKKNQADHSGEEMDPEKQPVAGEAGKSPLEKASQVKVKLPPN